MNVRVVFTSFALVIAVAACSRSESHACKPPRVYWQKPHNFAALAPRQNTVALTSSDDIYWNGKRISAQQLSRYLKLSHSLNPEPEVFLETEMGASCQAVENVRDEMDKWLDCNKPYPRCAEGIKSVWRALPTPPGTPVS